MHLKFDDNRRAGATGTLEGKDKDRNRIIIGDGGKTTDEFEQHQERTSREVCVMKENLARVFPVASSSRHTQVLTPTESNISFDTYGDQVSSPRKANSNKDLWVAPREELVCTVNSSRRLTNVIETALAGMKTFPLSDESQLARLLLRAEQERAIDNLAVEDALVAAIQDMMNLQSKLRAAETQIKELQNGQILYGEGLRDESTITTEPSHEAHSDRALQEALLTINTLQQQKEESEVQKAKLLTNLRKKKSLLMAAEAQQKALEHEVSTLRHEQEQLHTTVNSLRNGMHKITSVRDDLKNKLRIKQELVREARADRDASERRLKQSEKVRHMERELISLYRELSNHTGFYKWGKRIRVVEAELTAALAEEQNQD